MESQNLPWQGPAQHAHTYVCGLLSHLERKNVESIAYCFEQSRLPLQGFIGWGMWDDKPLRQVLREQVKTYLDQADGVLVFDPSGFPKSGRESVGAAWQRYGQLGKVDHCHVAIYLGAGPFQRPWQNLEACSQALEAEVWQRIDVRNGSKGPLVVEVVKRRVVSRTYRRQQSEEEIVVVIRYCDRDNQQVVKVDYWLSNARPETLLEEFARVAKAKHRIEECLQQSKREAGLADYEVRNWTGWQHHQTLSLLATWFLVRETQREKK